MIENKINHTTLNINLRVHDKKLESNKLFGLWIYLMSDCIMFAVLFAVYAVISSNISIDLISNKIFNLPSVLLETFLLLLSSLSCGFIVFAMNQKYIKMIYSFLMITFFLGFVFLFMEIYEFYELIIKDFGPDKNAFFSIFFTLIATHGIHIFFGLILIMSIIYQIKRLGLTHSVRVRILCLSVFWHFLDIIWICIFTFVYLNGAI
ncbi:MAG: cytochrome o ubiquinol oxidase subunit III [Buchnera aphidicola (Microlophium carnosum)]|uniref:Cytochrome bo(3) ubiquinol oxidase subunit 3 n=1 Tax=Buchnera aphidicola (Microlophium carnosum) TaxID=2708354 RepID=A0A6G9JVE9_9GAMM|nr:MAG: cytochrome o ubiquinol oxidase subunit III [Buchnera aphidicola (Microlophium carnosum)]